MIDNHVIEQAEILTEPLHHDLSTFTTLRGVGLKLQKVSAETARKAWTAIPIPKPPEVYIESRSRVEPNPADPGYLKELDQYNAKVNVVIYTIYLMRGVDVINIPVGLPGPEDVEEWNEGLEEYLPVPKGRLAKKAAWLMDFVLGDGEKDELMQQLMEYSGQVSEKKVDEAANSFRSNGVSEADQQVSPN